MMYSLKGGVGNRITFHHSPQSMGKQGIKKMGGKNLSNDVTPGFQLFFGIKQVAPVLYLKIKHHTPFPKNNVPGGDFGYQI